jgi:hypothetical protein
MDRFERHGCYARAWATGEVNKKARPEAWVAEAFGIQAFNSVKVKPLMTVDELDAELRRVGVPTADDEPDGDAEDRDARQLAEAQARLAKLIAAGGVIEPAGGSLCDAAAGEIVRLRHVVQIHSRDAAARGSELQQAKEALEQARAKHEELLATIGDTRACLLARPEDPTPVAARRAIAAAEERGAAEMRERAAILVRDLVDKDLHAGSVTVGRDLAVARIRALPISIEPQSHPLDMDAPDRRRGETVKALRAMGVEFGRALLAARIAEEEGGAAPETAHSAVLRMAKAGHLARITAPDEMEEFRRYIRGFMGGLLGKPATSAVLSAEDAETLRGAGWTHENVWTSPEADGPGWDDSTAIGLRKLQQIAAELRAKRTPAAASMGPGRVSGGDAAAGSSSVAQSGAPTQGLPKPTSIEARQRWEFDARDMGGELDEYLVAEVAAAQACLIGNGRTTYRGTAEILGSLRWRFLGMAPAPQDPKCDDEPEATPVSDAPAQGKPCGTMLDSRRATMHLDGEAVPVRSTCARASGDDASMEHLFDRKHSVQLVCPKDADPRAVLATVAELLGLSGPRDADKADERSVEQIEAEAWALEEKQPVLAMRMKSYARGIREGERRAKDTAAELLERWAKASKHAEREAKVSKGDDATRQEQRAATFAICVYDIRNAFGLPADPGQPPAGTASDTIDATDADPIAARDAMIDTLQRDLDAAKLEAADWASRFQQASANYDRAVATITGRLKDARRYVIPLVAPADRQPHGAARAALLELAETWERDGTGFDEALPDERARLKAGKTSRFMLGFLTAGGAIHRTCADDLRRLLDAPRGSGCGELEPVMPEQHEAAQGSASGGGRPRLYPVTPAVAALAHRIESVIVDAFSQPADGERRGPGAAREVLRLVEEWLSASK